MEWEGHFKSFFQIFLLGRNLRNFLKEWMLKGYRDFTSYETQTGSWLKQELMSGTVWHVHLIGSDERPAVRFNLFEDKLIYCLQVICLAQGTQWYISNTTTETFNSGRVHSLFRKIKAIFKMTFQVIIFLYFTTWKKKPKLFSNNLIAKNRPAKWSITMIFN